MTSFAPRQPVEGPNPYDAAQTFAESSVTVSTDKTKVEGGSIELSLLSGTGITFSLDNSTLSSVDSSGAIVNPNSDLNGVEVTAASGPSSLGDATLETTGGTVLDQAAIAPGETLTLQGTLTSGTDYRVYITANSIGSDYERPNFPVGTTDIDVTNGFYNGSSSQYVSLTKDITAIFGDATSGQAHVEWSAPTDIYGWDVTTFTRSPDGETVDVYVAVDDGSGWSRINSGDPISRNYSLADDPDVTASDDVRIEAELARSDTSNNPTLDSAYRSWRL